MGLFCSEDHFENNLRTGYLPISLLRRMFIESPTFAVGIKRLLSAPRHVSVNMIVATAEGEGLNIELTPNHYFISYPSIKKDIYTHSNHFKSHSFLAKDNIREGSRVGSSLFRDRRLEKGLLKSWPNIDENSFANALKDHLGFPDSLCLHIPESGKENTSTQPNDCTVASLIYNLTQKSVKLCRGQPCYGLFLEYQLMSINNKQTKN
jgi:isopenicillin-N N-acyltransferase-like protein